jgi:hypothetical protein
VVPSPPLVMYRLCAGTRFTNSAEAITLFILVLSGGLDVFKIDSVGPSTYKN